MLFTRHYNYYDDWDYELWILSVHKKMVTDGLFWLIYFFTARFLLFISMKFKVDTYLAT